MKGGYLRGRYVERTVGAGRHHAYLLSAFLTEFRDTVTPVTTCTRTPPARSCAAREPTRTCHSTLEGNLHSLDLVINLTTAKALGLTIPEAFLLRTDELIE